MHRSRTTARAAVVACALALAAAPAARAQAWNTPSFQQPRLVSRELNFSLADGGVAGTALGFQWRQAFAPRTQLSFDLGLAKPDGAGADTYFLVGGQFGYQMVTADREMPLDMMFTVGFNGAIGDPVNFVRVPVGVSLGHRFPVEGGMALTPYVHPRLSFDVCSEACFGPTDKTDLSVNVDLGMNFEFSRQLALRLSAMFGGSDAFGNDDAFGLSLAWTPPGVGRRPTGRRR